MQNKVKEKGHPYLNYVYFDMKSYLRSCV